MELLRHGIGFEITEDLSTVTLMHQLPRDNSLTQFVFQESLSFMHRARLLAAQIVGSALRSDQDTESDTDPAAQ